MTIPNKVAPLACHRVSNLCYALIDRCIDMLSVYVMYDRERRSHSILIDYFTYHFFLLFSRVDSNMSPNSQLEQEKRVRREIANSNERRRMQSINTGFQSLKILIPHSCGEKLSKVCYVF